MSRARRRDSRESPGSGGGCPHGEIASLVHDIEHEGIPCAWPLLGTGDVDCDETVTQLIAYEGTLSALAPAMFVVPTCDTHADGVRQWADGRTVPDAKPLTVRRDELAPLISQFHSGDDPLCQELPLRVALAPRQPRAAEPAPSTGPSAPPSPTSYSPSVF